MQAAQLVAAALEELRDRKKPRLSWGQGEKRERESSQSRAASHVLVRWQKRGEPFGETAVATHVCTYTQTQRPREPRTSDTNDPQRKMQSPISLALRRTEGSVERLGSFSSSLLSSLKDLVFLQCIIEHRLGPLVKIKP
jgi:hypothetical protein